MFSTIMVVNNVPHPAKLDGKGMEYFLKSDRNCISRRIRSVVARIVFFLPFIADGDDDDDDEAYKAVVSCCFLLN